MQILTWTKKVKTSNRLTPGEWSACKISNRVEIRTRLKDPHTLVVIKIEDLRDTRMKYGRQDWMQKKLIAKGEPFMISFGINGKFAVTRSQLQSINEAIHRGIERLEKDWAELNE